MHGILLLDRTPGVRGNDDERFGAVRCSGGATYVSEDEGQEMEELFG